MYAFSADESSGTTRSQEDEPLHYFHRLNVGGVDFDVVEGAVNRTKTQSFDLQANGGQAALAEGNNS